MACLKESKGSCSYKVKAELYSVQVKQVKLSAKSVVGKITSQLFQIVLMKQHNGYSTEWCIHSICLSIFGFYAVDKACLQLRIDTILCQKYKAKHES